MMCILLFCWEFVSDTQSQSKKLKIFYKNDLLKLVNLTLNDDVEFDEYSDDTLKNHAHQIIYKSIYEKLFDLYKEKDKFKDESERLFLQEYEKYKAGTS